MVDRQASRNKHSDLIGGKAKRFTSFYVSDKDIVSREASHD